MQETYSEYLKKWIGADRGIRKAVAYACRAYVCDDHNFTNEITSSKDNLIDKYDYLVEKINRFEKSSPRVIGSSENGKKKLTKDTIDNWAGYDDSTRQKPPTINDEDVAIKAMYFFEFGVKDQSGNIEKKYFSICNQTLEDHGVISVRRENRNNPKIDTIEEEKAWDRRQYKWEIDGYSQPAIDEEFASISVSTTQSASCEHPIGMLIDIYADSLIDEVTRIRLNFKSFRIVSTPNSYSKRITRTHNQDAKISNDGIITARGSKNSKFYDLTTTHSFLSGNYTTLDEPLFLLMPEDQEVEIETVLKVDKSQANVVFPNDVTLPSDLKQQIIDRVLINDKFPHSKRQDSVELHRVKQKIKAVVKNG